MNAHQSRARGPVRGQGPRCCSAAPVSGVRGRARVIFDFLSYWIRLITRNFSMAIHSMHYGVI